MVGWLTPTASHRIASLGCTPTPTPTTTEEAAKAAGKGKGAGGQLQGPSSPDALINFRQLRVFGVQAGDIDLYDGDDDITKVRPCVRVCVWPSHPKSKQAVK